jgi:coenzyme Q-binding protein COQ10
METYVEKRMLPYTPDQMFDLVADVESYGDFVPGWQNTRILESDGDVVYVEQEVGLGIFHTSFVSQGIFTRPESIEITSSDGPFVYLAVNWKFEAAEESGCMIRFHAAFELRSRFLEKFVGPIFSDIMRRCVSAFEQRAHERYAQYDVPERNTG